MIVRRILALLVLAGAALIGWSYRTALADPVVRRAELRLLPPGSAPLRIVLITDLHVAGPDMPPARLRRIVGQINALRPDLVLVAGDLVSDKRVATRRYPLVEAIAPLAGLRARSGRFAVLGNHDHWRSASRSRLALRRAGVVPLDNRAVRVGPLAIGGIDDEVTGHDDLRGTVQAMRKLGGIPVLLSHTPDPFAKLPSDVPLMLAGHTHCGQIRLPLMGPIATASRYGNRYACGLIRRSGQTLAVSAGLGTSLLPLRLGAVPDLWLLTLSSKR